MKTIDQYKSLQKQCETLFLNKNKDYGTSWRILRLTSLTDQMLIKARRIRQIEEAGEQQIADPIEDDYIGLINYAIMACLQQNWANREEFEIPIEELSKAYREEFDLCFELMLRKNNDYGEVWRDMRISSMTDLILMKLLRIRQIEDNEGRTVVSEGLKANYQDIVNYSIFALIKLKEEEGKI